MIEYLGAGITLLLALISGIAWLVRLEGRINTEMTLRESQLKNLLDRLGSFESRIYVLLKEIQETLRDKADK